MSLIRSKFKKERDMIYISHLDLLRLLERTMRRAKIKPAFTQGFNQHPKISFAQALSLGTSSTGEYVDIEVDTEITQDEFKNRMNELLPEGIEFVKCKTVDPKSAPLMGVVTHAKYIIGLTLQSVMSIDEVQSEIDRFMKLETITTLKRNKKGKMNEIDIRPMISSLSVAFMEDSHVYINAVLSTGSSGNLKPDILMNSIKENTDLDFLVDDINVHRHDIYIISEKGKLNTPI